MKDKFLTIIIFTFISIAGYSNDNFYIKIKRNKIEIGEYIGEKHNLKSFKIYDKENINLDEINSFLELKNKNVLFYFHGIQSNDIFNQKYALKRLEKINNADATVSVIWKSKSWFYTIAWKKAIHQGEEIAYLIESIIVNYDKTSILCHSMGHRLLEGIYIKKNQKFDKIFFAAPDLDMDVFEKNLKDLPYNCNRLFIYTNTEDKMLKLSKMAHRKERLGLNIVEQIKDLDNFENLSIIDVTNSYGAKKDRITKHSYWMKNPYVLEHINNSLKSHLKKRKYFILK